MSADEKDGPECPCTPVEFPCGVVCACGGNHPAPPATAPVEGSSEKTQSAWLKFMETGPSVGQMSAAAVWALSERRDGVKAALACFPSEWDEKTEGVYAAILALLDAPEKP